MSEAVIIAIMVAVFNAGVLWGTLRQIIGRMERSERSADRAHSRIDELTLRVGGTD